MIPKMNPLKAARLRKGLKQRDLAIIGDCSSIAIYQLEIGERKRVSNKMIKAYNAAGFNGEQLAREYQEWRKVHRQRLLDKKIDWPIRTSHKKRTPKNTENNQKHRTEANRN